MRILSSTHDFYDGARAFGADRELVYLRRPRTVDCDPRVAELVLKAPDTRHHGLFRPGRPNDGYRPALLLFCGELRPFFRRTAEPDTERWSVEETFLWSADEVHAAVESSTCGSARAGYGRKRGRWDHYVPFCRESVEDFFATSIPEADAAEIHQRIGSPVVLHERERANGRVAVAEADPVLKDVGFQRVTDPFATYQALSMYLGGVMAGAGNPMATVDDRVRAEKHGFDKWSFRKMGEGAKG